MTCDLKIGHELLKPKIDRILITRKGTNYDIHFPVNGSDKCGSVFTNDTKEKTDLTIDRLTVNCHLIDSKIMVSIKMKVSTTMMDFYYQHTQDIVKRGYLHPMGLKLFGNDNPTKEIMETATCVRAIKGYLSKACKSRKKSDLIMMNKNVLCVCVGDGIGPAVGYLIAGGSNWRVLSIDPLMADEWTKNSKIPNLKCIRDKMESCDLSKYKADLGIIISNHGHANFTDLWQRMTKLYKRVIGVSIPCCSKIVHHVKDIEAVSKYEVTDIQSDKRTVYIWDSHPEKTLELEIPKKNSNKNKIYLLLIFVVFFFIILFTSYIS